MPFLFKIGKKPSKIWYFPTGGIYYHIYHTLIDQMQHLVSHFMYWFFTSVCRLDFTLTWLPSFSLCQHWQQASCQPLSTDSAGNSQIGYTFSLYLRRHTCNVRCIVCTVLVKETSKIHYLNHGRWKSRSFHLVCLNSPRPASTVSSGSRSRVSGQISFLKGQTCQKV